MAWRIGELTLDPQRAELCGAAGPIHVERYTLEVLIYLVRNSDRAVSRDELLDAVWGGRIVSDATISTQIKHARKAIGDIGAAQELIRTIHSRGFRFVGEATPIVPAEPVRPAPELGSHSEAVAPGSAPRDVVGAGRPSLAVLRFQSVDQGEQSRRLADAFPAEMISNLSRIGWLHMIARGSSFQFDPSAALPEEVGTRLGVRYLATGMVELAGAALTITVELLSTQDGALIWSDRFACSLLEVQMRRREIVSSIIAALEIAIPEHEARGSRRLDANEFDAWSHFHLGLTHLYRFNAGDNLMAAQHFEGAVRADPDFARAYAGLSFVHWQTAFMQFGDDRRVSLDRAVSAANRALEIDRMEPFAAFNLGRARWLEGDLEAGLTWIGRSLQINPNSAHSNYCSGLVQLLAGAPDDGGSLCAKALSLSPLDPLSYAMQATRAMAAMLSEDFEEARRIADQAVNAPGAHFYIVMIAALAHELAGERPGAERYRDRALAQRPDVGAGLFFQAFPFQRREHRETIAGGFRRLGLA